MFWWLLAALWFNSGGLRFALMWWFALLVVFTCLYGLCCLWWCSVLRGVVVYFAIVLFVCGFVGLLVVVCGVL